MTSKQGASKATLPPGSQGRLKASQMLNTPSNGRRWTAPSRTLSTGVNLQPLISWLSDVQEMCVALGISLEELPLLLRRVHTIRDAYYNGNERSLIEQLSKLPIGGYDGASSAGIGNGNEVVA